VGDVDDTWTNSNTHRYWPQLFAQDNQLGDYDVYAFSYYSPLVNSAQNIYEISTQLFSELQDKEFFTHYDEIYIVAHSMGGLITEAMLSSIPCKQSDLLHRVRAVIYISTPAQGSPDYAEIATWFSYNPQFKNMSTKSAAEFLQYLGRTMAESA
jgi:pimeloyl-ACP methyl ester carboxylesterase